MIRNLLLFFLILTLTSSLRAAPPDCNAPILIPNRCYWFQFDPASNSELPKPSCATYLGYDRVYRFFATSSTMTIQVNGTGGNLAFQVLTGKCPNALIPVICVASMSCGANKNPSVTLEDLSVGAPYMLRVWSEEPLPPPYNNFSVILSDDFYEHFGDTGGDAQVSPGSNDCVSFGSQPNGEGCAFYEKLAGFNLQFFPTVDLSFTLNFGSLGADARNGMAFVLTTSAAGCGNGGYGLGAEGIPNSLIVEFDTWDDGTGLTPDIPQDHITIFKNGDFTTPVAGPFPVPGLPEFADGSDHSFRFFWDPNLAIVQVEFDGQMIINETVINIVTDCFGGYAFDPDKELRFGFTSSTGDNAEFRQVCHNPKIDYTPAMNETIIDWICEGFAYTSPNGNEYTTGGTFYESFIGVNGCPATRTIRLTKRELPAQTHKVVICAGETYNGYASSGTYQYLKSGINCDTAITLHLNVLDAAITTFKDNDIDCVNDRTWVYAYVPNLPVGPGSDTEISYQWSTPDGLIISGADTDSILVIQGGTYQLTMTLHGTSNGLPFDCVMVSAPVSVQQTYDAPTAVIMPNGQLSCASDEMVLDGGLSSPFNITYLWSSSSGGIVGSNNEAFVAIDKPGTYLLTVTHDISGCTDTATIKIVKAGFGTTAALSKTSDINCAYDTIRLSAAISDTEYDHLAWTTPDGHIISDTSLTEIKVDKAGEYFLTLFDENDCESVISITVSESKIKPVVNAGPDGVLNCNNASVSVLGDIDISSADYSFQWKDQSENILTDSDLHLDLSQAGTYVLWVYDSTNHCFATDTMRVSNDVKYPVLDQLPDQALTCQQTTIALNPGISNQGTTMSYAWTSPDGNFTGPVDALATSADQTGTYTLIAKNEVNGCADTIVLQVTGSTDQPDAIAGSDVILDCHNPFSTATGSFNSNDAATDIAINWSTPDGNIQGQANGLNINVASPGIYIISVTNLLNNCSDRDTLEVFKNDDKPIVNFLQTQKLTCLVDQLDIVPIWTNAGQNPTISWATVGGNIITVSPDSVIVVDQTGEYNLTVTNEETGCVTTGGVIIEEDKEAPDGTMGSPADLTCTEETSTVTFSPQGAGNYSFSWSTVGGNIVSGGNGQAITVNAPGQYNIEITNNDNGCKNTFSATVNASTDLPVVNAGGDDILNCVIKSVVLSGTVSNATDFDVTWTALSGGNIVNGTNTLNPEIDQAGLYVVHISNKDNGCKASDTLEIRANITHPEFKDAQLTDADCLDENGSISFSSIVNSTGPYSFTVNGKPVTATSLLFDDLSSGQYNIEVTDGNGCKSIYTGMLDKADEVGMTLPDTLVLVYGQPYNDLIPEFDFDTTGMIPGTWEGATYLDCNNCINPQLIPTYSATLSFTVTSAQGCTAHDEVYVRVRKRSGDFFVPNIFSPADRNGVNDRITVFTDSYTIPVVDEFRIFNRWGAQVFSRTNFPPNDVNLGWDGYFKGEICNPGVYVYFARFKTIDGEPIEIKGDLTLIR